MRISDGWTNRPPFGGCAATSPFSVATPRAYASSGNPRVRLRYWRNAARRVMPGLFSRAIMQSGAGLGYFNATLCSLESAQSTGARLMRRLGVENLDEARDVDAQTLFEGASRLEAPEGVDDAAWPMMVNWGAMCRWRLHATAGARSDT